MDHDVEERADREPEDGSERGDDGGRDLGQR